MMWFVSNYETRIALVGTGPSALSWLERFGASVPELIGSRSVEVLLIDPFPAGAGKIWRFDQSPLLKMNSLAGETTIFPDDSVIAAGPVAGGPTLVEWAEQFRRGDIRYDGPSATVARGEAETIGHGSFATRQFQNAYLDWSFGEIVERLPENVEVSEISATVLGVDDTEGGRQRLRLSDESVEVVDFVLYALGHTGVTPDARVRGLTDFAAEHGLTYLSPAYTSDLDVDAIAAGETVIVSGFGLSAVDVIVLLTEGRGGVFSDAGDGWLRYAPSGNEPHIHIGSRRGVPYHSKIEQQQLQGGIPAPVFVTPEVLVALANLGRPVDFDTDVAPLIERELVWAWYQELVAAHPDRVHAGWAEVAAELRRHEPTSDELRAFLRRVVPNADDRLDLVELFAPLGSLPQSTGELQSALREYIERDLRQRTSPDSSASLALFIALLRALTVVLEYFDETPWNARSRAVSFPDWQTRVFSFVASGPPPSRLRELLALVDAGVIEFAGAGLQVTADAERGLFVASSSNLATPLTARAYVEAWQPKTDAARTDDPALADLVHSGAGSLEAVVDDTFEGSTGRIRVRRGDNRVITAHGDPHPRRYAIGLYTNAPFLGAFSRPKSNALAFREFDKVARALLVEVANAPVSVRY